MKDVFTYLVSPIRLLLVLTLLIYCQELDAQSNTTETKQEFAAKNRDNSKEEEPKKVLDTDESIKYMGDRLMFQVKKRLHLLDEKEEETEKEEREKAKDVKFSIFGITIEKD